ncbi:unnamed protein product [Brassica oleracea var. botrytis]|uniref:Uncharacterized protein n=2 Tax=Brassica oleracea TaxID=3712 RepID=A0A0D3A1Z3_BRAOL|nr:unnamed protein product [Brassica oleracea]
MMEELLGKLGICAEFEDGGLKIDVRERRGEPFNEEGKFGGSGGGSTGEVTRRRWRLVRVLSRLLRLVTAE